MIGYNDFLDKQRTARALLLVPAVSDYDVILCIFDGHDTQTANSLLSRAPIMIHS